MTTTSRTAPSSGEVTGIGRAAVISAGASTLSRTGISATTATSAAATASCRQVLRLFSQRLMLLRSPRQAHKANPVEPAIRALGVRERFGAEEEQPAQRHAVRSAQRAMQEMRRRPFAAVGDHRLRQLGERQGLRLLEWIGGDRAQQPDQPLLVGAVARHVGEARGGGDQRPRKDIQPPQHRLVKTQRLRGIVDRAERDLAVRAGRLQAPLELQQRKRGIGDVAHA